MMRCMLKYRNETSGDKKGASWWSICHPDLAKIADEMAEVACPIKNFIRRGSNRMQCLYEQGAVTNFEFFMERLKTHLKFALIPYVPTAVAAEQALTVTGYKTKEVQICKWPTCQKPATVANCGSHYNPKNRRPLKTVVGMKIVDLKTVSDQWATDQVYHRNDKVMYDNENYICLDSTIQMPGTPGANGNLFMVEFIKSMM